MLRRKLLPGSPKKELSGAGCTGGGRGPTSCRCGTRRALACRETFATRRRDRERFERQRNATRTCTSDITTTSMPNHERRSCSPDTPSSTSSYTPSASSRRILPFRSNLFQIRIYCCACREHAHCSPPQRKKPSFFRFMLKKTLMSIRTRFTALRTDKLLLQILAIHWENDD